MDNASYYRERADHLLRLAEMTWQRDVEGVVRGLAQDYEEITEDFEAGGLSVIRGNHGQKCNLVRGRTSGDPAQRERRRVGSSARSYAFDAWMSRN
jgi:hypothetical protein